MALFLICIVFTHSVWRDRAIELPHWKCRSQCRIERTDCSDRLQRLLRLYFTDVVRTGCLVNLYGHSKSDICHMVPSSNERDSPKLSPRSDSRKAIALFRSRTILNRLPFEDLRMGISRILGTHVGNRPVLHGLRSRDISMALIYYFSEFSR